MYLYYIIVKFKLNLSVLIDNIKFNTRYTILFIVNEYYKSNLTKVTIDTIISFSTVKEISINKYKISIYIYSIIYFG